MRAPASLFKVVRAAALAGLSALSISCAASVEATGDEDTTPSHTHKHRRHKDGPTEEPTAQSSSNTTGQVETVKGGAIHTLFHDDWFGGVTLLGVDAKKGRAVVRLDSPSPPRLNIDSIDLVKGARADRWSASEPLAKKAITSGAFAPLSESLDVDAARFAKLLRTLGPWHLRPALASPTFAVADSGDRFLYGGVATDGSNGDWLFSIPAGADKPERVDGGLAASYSPVFSPGGKTVAFVGCTASPCDYGLFFVDGDNGRPHRVGNVRHAKAPVWTKDGASVLVVGARASDRCLVQGRRKDRKHRGAQLRLGARGRQLHSGPGRPHRRARGRSRTTR
ncbi:MAG: hypothetical protein U0271_14030 [Polyangiaceae bacterium]